MRAAELISCCQRPSLKTKHKCYKQTKLLTAPLMYHGIRGLWVIERSLEKNAAGRLFRVALRRATVARLPRRGDSRPGTILPASNKPVVGQFFWGSLSNSNIFKSSSPALLSESTLMVCEDKIINHVYLCTIQ